MRVLCRVLQVAESGYDRWRSLPLAARRVADRRLSDQIQQIFQQGRGVDGSPRVHAVLHQQGVRCGRKRVARGTAASRIGRAT